MGKQFRGEIRAQVIEFVNSWLGKNPNRYLENILGVLPVLKPCSPAFYDANKYLKFGSN